MISADLKRWRDVAEHRLRYAVVRALTDGLDASGAKGPPNTQVITERGRRLDEVVVRIVRDGEDIPARESATTIAEFARILSAAGWRVSRSRTRVRVSRDDRRPMGAPTTVCKR